MGAEAKREAEILELQNAKYLANRIRRSFAAVFGRILSGEFAKGI